MWSYRSLPQRLPQAEEQARGRAFVLGANEARDDPNVVTGTFLLNNRIVKVLFDSGADFSFMSINFKKSHGLKTSRLDTHYTIELANGKLISSGEVVRDCVLGLDGHTFSIDLLPIQLGSFDIVIGMDWLSKHRAEIICHEKWVRIPLPGGEILLVRGDRGGSTFQIMSCTKAQKCLRKGCAAFLAHVVEQKPNEPETRRHSCGTRLSRSFP